MITVKELIETLQDIVRRFPEKADVAVFAFTQEEREADGMEELSEGNIYPVLYVDDDLGGRVDLNI